MRKTLLAGTALAAAAAAPTFAQTAQGTLTIVSWGGAYSASQQNAYHAPYTALNPGVTIVNSESSAEAVARLRAMAEAGNVTWDIVDVTGADAIRLCDEGLAMEIDHNEWLAPATSASAQNAIAGMVASLDVDAMSPEDAKAALAEAKAMAGDVPATADFGETIHTACFIPQIVFSTTLGYRTDVEAWGGAEPDDLCDVFDLENFPGTRSLERRPISNLEWALICDGVAIGDVYDVLESDEGQARAFAKLDTIKDSTIWWTAGAETPQRLADGEAVIGSTYNGRLFSLIVEQNQPVKMLWDWQTFDLDGWIIPAGVSEEKLPLIRDYIRFATDTQRLADQAKYISYGPARASSAPLVSTHAELGIEMAPHMPTDPKNATNTFLFNYEWWADNRDDLDAKFQAWLTR